MRGCGWGEVVEDDDEDEGGIMVGGDVGGGSTGCGGVLVRLGFVVGW